MEIIEVYKTICIMMDGNFISRKRIGGIVALSFLQFGNLSGQERPNIVMILADDMGYSDIGCYGSEIETRILIVWRYRESG